MSCVVCGAVISVSVDGAVGPGRQALCVGCPRVASQEGRASIVGLHRVLLWPGELEQGSDQCKPQRCVAGCGPGSRS